MSCDGGWEENRSGVWRCLGVGFGTAPVRVVAGVTFAGKRSIMGVLSCGLGRGGGGLGRGGRGVVSGYFSGLGNDGKG